MRKVIIRVTRTTKGQGIECWCPTCGAKFNKTNWHADICGHCGQELDWTHEITLEKSGDGEEGN